MIRILATVFWLIPAMALAQAGPSHTHETQDGSCIKFTGNITDPANPWTPSIDANCAALQGIDTNVTFVELPDGTMQAQDIDGNILWTHVPSVPFDPTALQAAITANTAAITAHNTADADMDVTNELGVIDLVARTYDPDGTGPAPAQPLPDDTNVTGLNFATANGPDGNRDGMAWADTVTEAGNTVTGPTRTIPYATTTIEGLVEFDTEANIDGARTNSAELAVSGEDLHIYNAPYVVTANLPIQNIPDNVVTVVWSYTAPENGTYVAAGRAILRLSDDVSGLPQSPFPNGGGNDADWWLQCNGQAFRTAFPRQLNNSYATSAAVCNLVAGQTIDMRVFARNMDPAGYSLRNAFVRVARLNPRHQ